MTALGDTDHVAQRTMTGQQGTAAQATIVVADDDAVSRAATAARLRRLGYHVHEADDGRAGLALIERVRPDLAILDWMMPELDGPSVCEAVRRNESLKTCYLILLTALDQPEQLAEGLARGADDFLPKSATMHELLARIQAGLRTSRLIQEVEATHRELQSELAAADLYVRTLLPRPGRLGAGLTCAWVYRPSLALGGDLFMAQPSLEGTVYLTMLDASGHGVSAALRAAAFSTFLRERVQSTCNGFVSPEAILTEAGRRFPLSDDGFYFTCWLGCWQGDRSVLRYAAAGHGGALVSRRNGSVEWLAMPSLPLGFLPEAEYGAAEAALAAGGSVGAHERRTLRSAELRRRPVGTRPASPRPYETMAMTHSKPSLVGWSVPRRHGWMGPPFPTTWRYSCAR
ncbi:MAG: hypothetical protein KatS3mg082_2580 [Nitrospiraceae bacterium]|nr:MAG: hypothetical protein KatS3mg082_2580 [Nitrospiraceae bacterium]